MAETSMQAHVLSKAQQNMNACSGNIKYDEYQDQHWSPYCYDLQQSYFPWYNHCAPGYYYHRTPPEAWCNVPVYTYPHPVPLYKDTDDKCKSDTSITANEALHDGKGITWKRESESPVSDAKWQQKDATFGSKDDHTVMPMDISPRKAPFVPLKREVISHFAEQACKKNRLSEISSDPRSANASSYVHGGRQREKRSRKLERKNKVALEIPLSPRGCNGTGGRCHDCDSLTVDRSKSVDIAVKCVEESLRSTAVTEMRLVNGTRACWLPFLRHDDYPKDPRKRPLEHKTLPRALKLVRFQHEDRISKSSILDALKMGALEEEHIEVQNDKAEHASNLQQGSKECSTLPPFQGSCALNRQDGSPPGPAYCRGLICAKDGSFQSSSLDCNPSCENGDSTLDSVQCILNGGYEVVCSKDMTYSYATDVSTNLGGFILEESSVLACHLQKLEDGFILCFN